MANKRIDLKNIKPGLQVVCSEAPDATLYTIDEVSGLNVKLSYQLDNPQKTKASGGWIDYSVCRVPSAAQLKQGA